MVKQNIVMLLLAAASLFFNGCAEMLWSGANNPDIFDEQDSRIDEMLGHLAEADIRVLRIWIDLRLEMNADGQPLPVGVYDDCLLDQIDGLMVKAKRKGILLLITLHQYNWIQGSPLSISRDFYEWRRCKTPINVYNRSLTDGPQEVFDPYFSRGWAGNYLTNADAKAAYKQRVHHILNHINPQLGKPWKEINDVIWAWELQNEPEYLLPSISCTSSNYAPLNAWLNEMASYVKSIDPDTYVALGTKFVCEELGQFTDADIYTFHTYAQGGGDPQALRESTKKLFLLEEFPGYEDIMGRSRRNKFPWMFWEYGYNFDGDDIWHANDPETGAKDGMIWGARVYPAAKRIWNTNWSYLGFHNKWKVHDMVEMLCAAPTADCQLDHSIKFIDTFEPRPLVAGYHWHDERNPDSYDIQQGFLIINADTKQDLWSTDKRGAPMILRTSPSGNYRLETFLSAGENYFSPVQALNTQAGLFVYQDANNWLYFGLTHHNFTLYDGRHTGNGLMVTKTQGGSSSVVAISGAADPAFPVYPLTEDYVFLKIEKIDNDWHCYWKLQHDDTWNLLATVTLPLASHEIGMGIKTFDIAPSGDEYPGQANFDYFLIGTL
jgi:regulation of enolase protein 1 (concanavalin A-like superfamily)